MILPGVGCSRTLLAAVLPALSYAVGVVVGCAALAACSGAGNTNPDDEFGHRWGENAPDGRETLLIPIDSADIGTFLVLPAAIDSVVVRADQRRVAPGQVTSVEVLVKGALPDACSSLHRVEQRRTSHMIDVTITMRQPRGRICANVVRPFRFYVTLDGEYAPGSYALTINGASHPFQVLSTETTSP